VSGKNTKINQNKMGNININYQKYVRCHLASSANMYNIC
jgi:hypothetical protein